MGERPVTQALTSTEGQENLPRYFAAVMGMGGTLNSGRVDFVLADGRRFRIEGAKPGPVAEIHIHNPDTFARLIREGHLGFADAYLEGWWSTPDLQAFMDVVHADNDEVYNSFGGMFLVRAWERLRHWMNSNRSSNTSAPRPPRLTASAPRPRTPSPC